MAATRKAWIGAGLGVLLIALAVVGLAVLRPAPPSRIVMATGTPDGAYHIFGRRYQQALARHGIQLELRETAGAVENLSLLEDPASGVSFGFVQGGLTSSEKSPDLQSLGTVFREPMWLFFREPEADSAEVAADLRGRSLSIDVRGTGTNALARHLLDRVGLTDLDLRIVELPAAEARVQMLAGQLDGMVLVTPWENPIVQQLLHDPGITLKQFPRADAIVALTPFLGKETLVRGVADLARDLPPTDLTLIANKGSLVIRRELHPALQYLLLDAATQIHAAPGVFNRGGEFPAAVTVDLPLSAQAQQFYRSGRPFLQRYLPFWLAVLVERLLFVLIPIIGVIYPVVRLIPSLYAWGMRQRIYHLYGELKVLETELAHLPEEASADQLRHSLAQLEKRANALHVPSSFGLMLYTLRSHIALVRATLTERGQSVRKP